MGLTTNPAHDASSFLFNFTHGFTHDLAYQFMQPVRSRYAVSADMGRPISAERPVLTASAGPRSLLITLGHDSVSYGFAAPRQDV